MITDQGSQKQGEAYRDVIGDLLRYAIYHLHILRLTQTKMPVRFYVGGHPFLADNEDYGIKLAKTWYRHPMGYLTDGKQGRFHREVMQAEKGQHVDHINGNIADNRKQNLRICTHADNMRNRRLIGKNNKSGYKGVSWSKVSNKWIALINYNKKCKYLGVYHCKIEAAKAYDSAARRLFGQYAKCNLP